MSKIAALKKKATELEQKKQFDKALATYIQVLEESESSGEEIDVGLYNRVGDLMLRGGNVGDAVTYYEKAVDLYSDGGFFNNAIALCNKILRQSPGRTNVYYKLGKISAQKGFKSDAKKNFLEYADRMQQAGQTEEAFRALKEFADLSPDQDDIRLMLADQLSKQGKKDEAMEQFQSLLDKYDSEGRQQEARATIDRMKAIDPAVEPRPSGQQKQRKSTDLVFLDLSADEPPRKSGAQVVDLEPPPAAPAVEGLELTSFGSEPEPEHRPAAPVGDVQAPPSEPIELDLADAGQPAELDLEVTGAHVGGGPDSGPPADLPLLDTSGEAPSPEREITFISADDEATQPRASTERPVLNEFDSGSSGDIQFMDLTSTQPDLEPIELDVRAPLGTDEQVADVSPAPRVSGSAQAPADAQVTPEDVNVARETPDDMPRVPRKSTSILARSVDGLRISLEIRPDDWSLRRTLGEALLEDGEREAALAELDAAMVGYEKAGDLDSARSVADEIVRVNADSIRHLQKRVEYAFRASDRPRLADCYVELADAMLRTGQTDKSRSVYQRVLELNPDDIRAQMALSALAESAPPAPEPVAAPARPSTSTPRRSSMTVEQPAAAAPEPALAPAAARPAADDDFIDLGAWLREDEVEKDTRMVVAEEEPTGDEEADFQDMLKKFKQGVSENVDDEDFASHYDLGVAYKEMGLIDEAISEFQKALRAPELKVRCYEALGQCFMEKGQPQIATTILTRALNEKAIDDAQLIGVLYLLGNANEELKKPDEALNYYNRVFSVDIQFRDVGERINALEKVGR